ncbi:MAG: ribonuclease III, partial [SAR202 cluster bacterium]|nr:ribonuclease III [SAR202 cluster bacterium]
MEPQQLKSVEAAIGVRFRDLELLKLSLIHSSYINEHPLDAPASNERLEYLGDALLGMAVANRLYQDHPEMPEGDLTAARAAIVCGECLSEAAADLGLGDFLFLGQGEEQSGGRSKPSNLAAGLEALVGAVYLDQGYAEAEAFGLRILKKQIDRIDIQSVPRDAKSTLQEAMQAEGRGTPTYNLLDETGPGHARTFTIEVLVAGESLGEGRGQRKSDA